MSQVVYALSIQMEARSPMSTNVNHPSHYNVGKIEVIDFIEDQALDFHLGNAVKYICRAECKGEPVEDLRKAIWYLNRQISLWSPSEQKGSESSQATTTTKVRLPPY